MLSIGEFIKFNHYQLPVIEVLIHKINLLFKGTLQKRVHDTSIKSVIFCRYTYRRLNYHNVLHKNDLF